MNAPYYIIPLIEELEKTSDPDRQNQIRRRIAANVGDQEALMQLFGLTSIDSSTFYPDQLPPELSTVDTIDAFLDRFGSGKDKDEKEENRLETAEQAAQDDEKNPQEEIVPIVPAVDYLTLLEMESGQQENVSQPELFPGESSLSGLAATIGGGATGERQGNEQPALTESFAKVLIKNGNYSRAMEILRDLSLKNPEKSVYFADQMRFLTKLQAISKACGKDS